MKQIHKFTFAAALIGALALGNTFSFAAKQTQKTTGEQQGQLSRFDREFLTEAAQMGQAELALVQAGQQKGFSEDTKRVANELTASHKDANQQLSQLAANKGVQIPNQPTASERSRIEDIQKLQGERFDKDFHNQLIKDHRRSISLYEKAAKSASDPDIRSWAQRMVPVLQQHLAMIEKPTAVGEPPRSQYQQRQKIQQQQQEGTLPTVPR